MNLFEQYNPKQLAAMTIEDIKKHRKLRNGEAITYANRTMAKYLKIAGINTYINLTGEHELN